MRVLIVQMQANSSEQVRPRFDQWLAVLASVLRQDRHELELAAFSRYRSAAIHESICRFRPNAIYVQADRFAADITRHAVEFIGKHHVLPVVIGGPYPTAQPEAALSIPGVLAVAIGEPEVSVRQFLWALERGEDHERTPGIWINAPDGPPVKNELAALTDQLDSLPFADRELFDTAAQVERTHAVPVSVGRGCPNRCGYCLNDWLAEINLGRGAWARRRSPANICAELDELCERYPQIERVQFVDHLLALDADWLAEFAQVYPDRCGLPFSCHVRLNAATARTVRLLQQAGCDHAICEVISGSDFIRNEIFELGVSDRQIERAFRLLKIAKIRTTAVHLLGSPYETTITVEHTVDLLQRVRPDRVHTRLFAPLPGTRAEEVCRDSGWLTGLGEKAFRDNIPMLRLPALPGEVITTLFDKFNWQGRHPRTAWLMRLLNKIPISRRRSLYDLLVRQPRTNGHSLAGSDPRSVVICEHDGVMNP